MKLFIWEGPFSVWYGDSLCFAVAESVEQAREIAKTARFSWNFKSDGTCKEDYTLGEPTRILDLPAAEVHVWSE